MEGSHSRRNSSKVKGKFPEQAPINFSNEIRFTEVDVSLYSEFSDLDNDSTTNEISKLNNDSGKEMFSKQI